MNKNVVPVGAIMMLAVFLVMTCWSGGVPVRPKILEISQARISVTNLTAAREFYSDATGTDIMCHYCETSPPPAVAVFPSGQRLDVAVGDPAAHSSRVTELAFGVDDLKHLKQLLQTNKIPFQDVDTMASLPSVVLKDPEGNALRFVPSFITARAKVLGQEEKPSTRPDSSEPRRIIHVGFVVKDRAAMDKFYKDILGFHVYWRGGMKDGETNWVDMQLPDGTDWIEYMLNVPENADKHTLGEMNHIALGVRDIHAAQKQLIKNGWNGAEEPQIGRDGKWQLNLYDPDGTRVELMEFTPVEKPCCSEYTGPHPKL